MPHHCRNSEHGCSVGCRRELAGMIAVRLSFVALDTGDADEFTFATAGGFACFCGVRPHKQGETGAG